MCFSCGSWPWGNNNIHVADAPTKDEYIFLDANHSFYPDHRQGFHPPAPVYQGQAPNPATYYYAHNSGNPTPTPYYAHGYYYAAPQTASSGYYCHPLQNNSTTAPTCKCNTSSNPYCYSVPTSTHACSCSTSDPYNYSAAAAAAAAAGAATAAQPTYYLGASKAEVDAQNAAMTCNTGATVSSQLAPYKPAASQQFWCKELDGSWTLRTNNDMVTGELSPGHWEMSKTGYHYWVRSNPT